VFASIKFAKWFLNSEFEPALIKFANKFRYKKVAIILFARWFLNNGLKPVLIKFAS
jgi:hypothetical protein